MPYRSLTRFPGDAMVVGLLITGLNGSASAQVDRYELGLRVRECEMAERCSLTNAGACLREYTDCEHLFAVQHALPDVFAFFDKAAR